MKLLKDPYSRVFFYILLFLFFVLLGNFPLEELKICPFERFFGVLCPGCGTTRAFTLLLKWDISGAFQLNPLFVLFIFPASVTVFFQDAVCAVMKFFGKNRLSFMDFIIEGIFGEKK